MKNVLIVEDDPMVAMINEEYLSSFQNIKVLGRTFTEKDTLDFLTTHKVDLSILDVFLGEENGIEILKKIRTLGYTTDVIMITSANGGEDIKKAFSFGCIDYLIKPFDFERLKISIDKIFTRDEILNKSNEEFGIKDICQITDISNVTIKKYLDYLENIKYITSFTNYGNIGRPLYLYKKIR